jgi:hypothetical protein
MLEHDGEEVLAREATNDRAAIRRDGGWIRVVDDECANGRSSRERLT